jgi:hypothetical protein
MKGENAWAAKFGPRRCSIMEQISQAEGPVSHAVSPSAVGVRLHTFESDVCLPGDIAAAAMNTPWSVE